jgi:hypothetical protein
MEATPGPFTLEDARRLAVVRSLVLVIEKDASELTATNASCEKYPEVVKKLRALLKDLKEMRQECQRSAFRQDCWDDYEMCEDGICRVWCS